MKIFFTKKQYHIILQSLTISSWIYGIMSDSVDEKYKETAAQFDEIENYVLGFHKDFSFAKQNIASYEKKLYLSEEFQDEYIDDISAYNNYEFWDNLITRLAVSHFEKQFSQTQIDNMEESEKLRLIFGLEDKYNTYISEHGLKEISAFLSSKI